MLQRIADRLRGKFVVLDGPDGAGKTSCLDRLQTDLATHGGRVVRAVDPGGTVVGSKIRQILLEGKDLETMDPRCETLLFMASRAQLVTQVIQPAVQAGHVVLCDRFISATMAYQGAVGVDPREVCELGRFAVGSTWPDLTIVLDVPTEVGLARAGRLAAQTQGGQPDAMERRSLEFHRRVAETFRRLADLYPAPVAMVDASGSQDEVYQAVLEAIADAGL